MPSGVPLAIFLVPFLGFIVIAFVIRPFLNHRQQLSGYIATAAIGTSFALSLWVLIPDSMRDRPLDALGQPGEMYGFWVPRRRPWTRRWPAI